MARKTKARTINVRELNRKDRRDVALVELQSAVANIFAKTNFTVSYSTKSTSGLWLMAVNKHVKPVWTIGLAVYETVGPDQFNSAIRTRERIHSNELWIIGRTVSRHMHESRETFPPGVRVFNIVELERLIRNYSDHFLKVDKPVKPRKRVTLRTVVGKAVLANADQLRAAATTSIILIEERLEVLNHSRPNAEESKQRKEDEIQRLTVIRGQLETLRDYPNLLKTGQVKEAIAVDTVKSLSQGVGEYWAKHTDTICDKMLNFGLFTSLVVVGKIVGVTPEIAFGLAGAMTYGKPVVDALKAMKGWFKR